MNNVIDEIISKIGMYLMLAGFVLFMIGVLLIFVGWALGDML